MSVGKYSPTVADAYHTNQEWWEENGGGLACNLTDPYDGRDYDNDGYDSYGYDKDDKDRAGVHEHDYVAWEPDPLCEDNVFYRLYEDILFEWTTDLDTGLPKKC